MKKIVILGLGISGKAAAALFLKRGYFVIGVEEKNREDPRLEELKRAGLTVVSKLENFDGVEKIVFSPGILPNHPLLVEAKRRDIAAIGEAEAGLSEIKNRAVGVTGTNGKTTTVLLVEHILRFSKKKARAIGNVGKSITEALLDLDPEEIFVVELSSFQIESLQTKALDAAYILNITPNHLDRYTSMEEYAAAKAKIQHCLKENGKLFLSKQVKSDYGYLFREFAVFDELYEINLIETKKDLRYEYASSARLTMPAKQNIVAAFSICRSFGVKEEIFFEGLQSFQKPKHRIEWVAEIDGVAYYNDSKSSNVESVLHAVEQFDGPLLLLAGGVHKGSSYFPWIEPFQGKVKRVIAFGSAKEQMEEELGEKVDLVKAETLNEALLLAKNGAQKGDTVLLSPGCSSYDQFQSFEHRGEEFKKCVERLKGFT